MGFSEDEMLKIINNGSLNADERIEALRQYRAKIDEQIQNEINKIEDSVFYCLYCRKSYLNSAWNIKNKIESRRIVESSLCEFDDFKIKKKDCVVEYRICPCGHKIETDIKELIS